MHILNKKKSSKEMPVTKGIVLSAAMIALSAITAGCSPNKHRIVCGVQHYPETINDFYSVRYLMDVNNDSIECCQRNYVYLLVGWRPSYSTNSEPSLELTDKLSIITTSLNSTCSKCNFSVKLSPKNKPIKNTQFATYAKHSDLTSVEQCIIYSGSIDFNYINVAHGSILFDLYLYRDGRSELFLSNTDYIYGFGFELVIESQKELDEHLRISRKNGRVAFLSRGPRQEGDREEKGARKGQEKGSDPIDDASSTR